MGTPAVAGTLPRPLTASRFLVVSACLFLLPLSPPRAVIWTSVKIGAGMALLGLFMYAGYTIVTTLLPLGASSNAIMRRASDIILSDPEVLGAFGTCKTYGVDPGGRAEGRRFFVPEYKYDDPLTGDS